MQHVNFAYWLQGFFELSKAEELSADQVKIIRNHINLVKKCEEPLQFGPNQSLFPASNQSGQWGPFGKPRPDGKVTYRC